MYITNIDWDSKDTGLPKEMDLPKKMDIDEIAEYLASETGWCCNSFVVEKRPYGKVAQKRGQSYFGPYINQNNGFNRQNGTGY